MGFNRMARIAGLSAVLVAVLVVAHPAPLAAKGKSGAGKEVVWPARDITFEQTPAKGVTKADLWGNAAKGAHGSLVKFAAGTDNGLHTHTYDIKAVVISGTFLYGSGGAAPQKLGPGSYLLIPGGMKHTSACEAGADCLFFEEQPWEVRHQASEGRRRGEDEGEVAGSRPARTAVVSAACGTAVL